MIKLDHPMLHASRYGSVNLTFEAARMVRLAQTASWFLQRSWMLVHGGLEVATSAKKVSWSTDHILLFCLFTFTLKYLLK